MKITEIKKIFPIGSVFIPVNAPSDVFHTVQLRDKFKKDSIGNINLTYYNGEYKLLSHNDGTKWFSCLYSSFEGVIAEKVK